MNKQLMELKNLKSSRSNLTNMTNQSPRLDQDGEWVSNKEFNKE